MQRLKRKVSLLLAILMLFTLAPMSAQAAPTVYFTAVNDRLLDLSDETMPFWSGNTLYVSQAIVSGTDLSIAYSRSRDKMTAVLYKSRSVLIFDLAAGTVYDSGGTTYNGAAIVRGDNVFMPLSLICNFFELEYSYTKISYGYLVRVKNESVVLSDSVFIDAASSPMKSRYAQYEKAKAAEEAAAQGSQTADNTPAVRSDLSIYLLFRMTEEVSSAQTLSILGNNGCCAAWILSPEEIAAAAKTVRQAVATGNSIVLYPQATKDAQSILDEIERGNNALWKSASVKTRLVYAPEVTDDVHAALEEAGYCVIEPEVDYSTTTSGTRIAERSLTAADAHGGDCCVYLGDDTATARYMGTLLSRLRAAQCNVDALNEVVA